MLQMLELSNDYSPVISPYKEASVLAYHADASVVEMQLTADCFAAVKGPQYVACTLIL
jgi:hypothetical protein